MADSPSHIKEIFADEPILGLMWEEYEMCRAQQWVHFSHRSRDGKKETPIHAVYPTHIATWPREGGILNQPYVYVKVFRAFLEGEREGTLRKIDKMRKD